MTIHILTIFPEFFSSVLQTSILQRAQEKKIVSFHIINIRDFSIDTHKTTDDKPFGGGPGMVMKVDSIDRALDSLQIQNKKVVLTSAKGKLFTQQDAQRYSLVDDLVFICGHYEGVDERVAQYLADEEVRIGNYVLTGGEPAAMVMTDAVVRLIPGVLGNKASNKNESHSQPGFLNYPVYTRPEVYKTWKVPKVLLSGHHAKIEAWKKIHQEK